MTVFHIKSLSYYRLMPVVERVDCTIHQINQYPLDTSIGFGRTCPKDSGFSAGRHYPTVEQLGPGARFSKVPKTFRAELSEQLLTGPFNIFRFPGRG